MLKDVEAETVLEMALLARAKVWLETLTVVDAASNVLCELEEGGIINSEERSEIVAMLRTTIGLEKKMTDGET